MKTYKMIGIAVGAIIAGTVITLAVLNPNSYAETRENAAGDLHTRRYDLPDEVRFDQNGKRYERNELNEKSRTIQDIEWILSKQITYGRNWKVVQTLVEKDSAIIKAEVPVVIFTDDLEGRIQFSLPENLDSPTRKAVINVRSASRIGNSDLGENRRHIKQLLDEFEFAFRNDRINL